MKRNKERCCFLCNESAHYWTQASNRYGRRLGDEVWHCQRHRFEARRRAWLDADYILLGGVCIPTPCIEHADQIALAKADAA